MAENERTKEDLCLLQKTATESVITEDKLTNGDTFGLPSPRSTGCFIDWLAISFPPTVTINDVEECLQGIVPSGSLEAAKAVKQRGPEIFRLMVGSGNRKLAVF